MKLSKDQKIAGFPALRIRDLFKRHSKYIDQQDVSKFLEVSPRQAQTVLKELAKEGYLEPSDQEGLFATTNLALRLRNVSAMKRMTREKVEELLQGLLERAAFVNESPEFTAGVKRVTVFGSYLDQQAEDFGDLDVAVSVERKPGFTPEDEQAQTKRDMQGGKRFSGWMDQLIWPTVKVIQFLKDRKAGIQMVFETEHQEMLRNIPTKVFRFDI